MALFEPERHVTLPVPAWQPARARQWLECWSADTLAAHGAGGWPVHPRDASDFEKPPAPLQCLYFGAAGVWVALCRVADAGICRLPASRGDIFAEVLADYDRSPDLDQAVPSWFLGEAGILTASLLARADPARADRLAEVIRGNRDNPTREMLWGAPGTMLAALTLYKHTGEARWVELFRDSVAALWESWFFDEQFGCWLWEQDMYGSKVRYFGAGHGWAGNLYALWRGSDLLTDEQQEILHERTLQGLKALAIVEGDVASWPIAAKHPPKQLVQWCHGAPGLITSLRHAELPEVLPLLLQCARTTVAAGALSKGISLCHGTDGNGMALLEIHRRTQDPAWLARAREFAMVAIDQSEASFREHGQWRPSLWTGDAGLACFLLDCLEGSGGGGGLPGLDSFW